jgi:hypothetical protein
LEPERDKVGAENDALINMGGIFIDRVPNSRKLLAEKRDETGGQQDMMMIMMMNAHYVLNLLNNFS